MISLSLYNIFNVNKYFSLFATLLFAEFNFYLDSSMYRTLIFNKSSKMFSYFNLSISLTIIIVFKGQRWFIRG